MSTARLARAAREALRLEEAKGLFHFAPASTAMYTRRDDLTLCGIATSALPWELVLSDSDAIHNLHRRGQPDTCEECLKEWRRCGFLYYEPRLQDPNENPYPMFNQMHQTADGLSSIAVFACRESGMKPGVTMQKLSIDAPVDAVKALRAIVLDAEAKGLPLNVDPADYATLRELFYTLKP